MSMFIFFVLYILSFSVVKSSADAMVIVFFFSEVLVDFVVLDVVKWVSNEL